MANVLTVRMYKYMLRQLQRLKKINEEYGKGELRGGKENKLL